MAFKVVLPKMGLTMVEGKILKWLKPEGDEVRKGDPLFELQTDKVTVEVEAEAEGILKKILAPAGRRYPVGTVVAVIAAPEEDISSILDELAASLVPRDKTGLAGKPDTREGEGEMPRPSEAAPRAPSSPAARRVARELGVEISFVKGTGPGGRVTEEDVRAYWEAQKKAVPSATPLAKAVALAHGIDLSSVEGTGACGKVRKEDVEEAIRSKAMPYFPRPVASDVKEVIPLEGRRKTIADRMSRSARTYASVTISREADFGRAKEVLALLRKEAEGRGTKLTLTDLLAFALLKALQRHPHLNSTLTDQGIAVFEEVNLGIAVDAQEGLVVPVIRKASSMDLFELSRERSRLVEAARLGKISPSELEGGTFTLSNLGQLGVDSFTPIINPPETAILGVGRILDRPWVSGGSIVIKPVGWLSLTFDHRVVDGAPAARFLGDLSRLVEEPYLLLG